MTNEIKKDTNKCFLNKFQENTNKKLNEIRKIIQDKEKEFNKDRNSEEKNQIKILEMKNSVSQMKNSVDSLSSRLHQIEDRISGL
jgi:predicted  nucleic acid-binding Zn-ribbon protein